ncbi:MAG: hypothetical protein KIT80_09740 [Chitinophagaceae bacterium]|nr:hypothetical protein [Chitinophagaceae bacterium]MCW5927181.1 hypothetical protein [Chitinophagaceae bacterium]
MSLKGLKLSAETIAGLYTLPLHQDKFAGERPAAKQPVDEKSGRQYLGDNLGYITILVNHSDAPYVNNELFEFLTGILNACKLSMKDVALFNLHRTPANHQVITAETKPATMLLLGVAPEEIGLPMQFPHFQVYKHNNIRYLSAPALQQIFSDKALKSGLWKALKAVFELS